MRLVWIVMMIWLLIGCDRVRIYEVNNDFASAIWRADSVQRFSFAITEGSRTYDLFANFTNEVDYPYYNLYYQYSIADSLNREVKSGLLNAILFDAKSGEPKGSGLGDLYDHRSPILRDFTFPTTGRYVLSLQQYMRIDSLPGIRAVGVRIAFTESK